MSFATTLKKNAAKFNTEAQQLFDRWRKLSTRQRSQFVFGLCAFLIVFYTLIIHPAGEKKLENLRYREEKLNVRIKSSSGNIPTPSKQDRNELSLEQANREIARIENTLENLKKEEQRLLQRFVALDNLEGVQVLKSALAQLAESGDMEIIAIEHIYTRREDRNAPPTKERLLAAGQGNPYKRPLLHFRARASYRGLMRFLDGLGDLPYIAAPVWSNIRVNSEKRPKNASNSLDTGSSKPREWLEVELHLAF
ncbi:MAG: hypothetical protein LBC37_01505 [Zoogloeaceae bacterium]|jgi:type II secretory pathway component PulM|nr:hypothetical protein [Zoogloeaceae bacterium]